VLLKACERRRRSAWIASNPQIPLEGIQLRFNSHSSYTSPVETLTLNAGDRVGFLCSLDHPLVMRDALSAGAWKDQLSAPRDSFIRLSRE